MGDGHRRSQWRWRRQGADGERFGTSAAASQDGDGEARADPCAAKIPHSRTPGRCPHAPQWTDRQPGIFAPTRSPPDPLRIRRCARETRGPAARGGGVRTLAGSRRGPSSHPVKKKALSQSTRDGCEALGVAREDDVFTNDGSDHHRCVHDVRSLRIGRTPLPSPGSPPRSMPRRGIPTGDATAEPAALLARPAQARRRERSVEVPGRALACGVPRARGSPSLRRATRQCRT